jgi:hypothetical protein
VGSSDVVNYREQNIIVVYSHRFGMPLFIGNEGMTPRTLIADPLFGPTPGTSLSDFVGLHVGPRNHPGIWALSYPVLVSI